MAFQIHRNCVDDNQVTPRYFRTVEMLEPITIYVQRPNTKLPLEPRRHSIVRADVKLLFLQRDTPSFDQLFNKINNRPRLLEAPNGPDKTF